MKPGSPYQTAAALRRALETRLRRRIRETPVPLDRLRKEVAHQRLLARLALTAPPDSWALKAGLALLARLDKTARATKDADTNWRASFESLTDAIQAATEADLGDGFAFEISSPRPLEGETSDGGLRYPVLALLDGREFERVQLDVNVVPDDPRPVERLRLRDLLAFAGIEPPVVPVILPAQHLAEKLHAYSRDYASGDNSRPRDLFDMLVIARGIHLPTAESLEQACRQTFALRGTAWPPLLLGPPPSWETEWATYVRDHAIVWDSLDGAGQALLAFWTPLLAGKLPPNARWHPRTWGWSADG